MSTPPAWAPITPEALVELLADLIADTADAPADISADASDAPGTGTAAAAPDAPLRVAVDGAPCAEPGHLAAALEEPLRLRSRPTVHIRADTFWRDASVRLEHGHEDVESYAAWLDEAALQREVLAAARERRTVLPSLRDPVTDRSTRASALTLPPGAVVIVSGELLLGRGLDFDLTVHLDVSAPARVRRTPPDRHWTLPAFDVYDERTRPVEAADVAVRSDDPRHPAVRVPAP